MLYRTGWCLNLNPAIAVEPFYTGDDVLHRLRNVLLMPSAGAGVSETTCTGSVILKKTHEGKPLKNLIPQVRI